MLTMMTSILILLVVLNISLPTDVLDVVDKGEVKILVIIASLMVAYHKPLIGTVGLISYFVLVHNTKNMERKKSFGEGPSEKYKKKYMNSINDSFPVTLEEEVIRGVESNKTSIPLPSAEYKPMLEKTCNQSLKIKN